ncbi:helix-turn-helix domain-containing protein [Vallitalea okinawensis]|uniref:helix-turn-helix domain-containing protein n=1 Tax=Vallitalea okinawensis TaxID=2078660 RepID=UPI000CFDE069|nr:AraC family transcriptional regulator [Vallitalea okinawensis]
MVLDESYIYTFDKNNYLMKVMHECIQQKDIPYRSTSTHCFRIILIQDGEGSVVINNDRLDIIKNDILVLNNTESYKINSLTNKELSIFTLVFEPSFVSSLDNYSFDLKYLKVFIDRNNDFKNLVCRDNTATKKVLFLILEIEKEFHNKNKNYKLMSKVHLLHILVLLSRYYHYINRMPQQNPFTKEKILSVCKVINYMNENIASSISLSELTQLSNMSQSNFAKAFKELNGIPPMEYLKRKRISYGIQLLTNTDRTVLDIALSCGYNNTSNFNRTFKQLVGKTPRELRK